MTPYYADGRVTLYLGKYEDVLPALAIDADLIVADPPYAETALSWDQWPDGWPARMVDYARSMWVFGSMRMFLDRRDEFDGWRLSQDVVWEKHNGSSLAADRFSRVHEHALFWYHGPWSEIHHETPRTLDATTRTVRKKAKPAHHQGGAGPSTYTSVDGGPRLMRSVLYRRSMHGRGTINATEKPVDLVAPLIEYACPPGGLVLDPFAGSCSTGIAARRLGRRAVLIEEREEQCESAVRERLSIQELDLNGEAA